MKKLILSVATFIALAGAASAAGGPFSAVPGQQSNGFFARVFEKKPLPAFQAAPWYLYWPYNAHFMTPAPLQGAYYAPPTAAPANPYFPGR